MCMFFFLLSSWYLKRTRLLSFLKYFQHMLLKCASVERLREGRSHRERTKKWTNWNDFFSLFHSVSKCKRLIFKVKIVCRALCRVSRCLCSIYDDDNNRWWRYENTRKSLHQRMKIETNTSLHLVTHITTRLRSNRTKMLLCFWTTRRTTTTSTECWKFQAFSHFYFLSLSFLFFHSVCVVLFI